MSCKKILTILLSLVIALSLLSGCAKEEKNSPTLDDVTETKEGYYECSFDGVDRGFYIYLPEKTEGAPLVLMLHGAGDSAEVFRNNTHFEEDACARGYAVAYVNGAANPYEASGRIWNSGIAADGNNDVDFLRAISAYLQETYSLDADRTFVIGFSAGAFMTQRLAMEASDTFAAVVSVAGKLPASIWDSRNETNDVGIMQISGSKDDVVPKNSDGTAAGMPDPAIEDVMEYWAESNGLSLYETADIGKSSTIMKYGSSDTDNEVWSVVVDGGRHSWPSESLYGINTNELILEFLDTQKKESKGEFPIGLILAGVMVVVAVSAGSVLFVYKKGQKR